MVKSLYNFILYSKNNSNFAGSKTFKQSVYENCAYRIWKNG